MAGPAQSLAVCALVAPELVHQETANVDLSQATGGPEAGERLWNGAGIGDVRLDEEGAPTAIRQLDAGGGGTIFQRRAKDD